MSIEINLNNKEYEPYIDRSLKNGITNGTTEENSYYTKYIEKNGKTNREPEVKVYEVSTVRLIIAILLTVKILLLVANIILAVLLSNFFYYAF